MIKKNGMGSAHTVQQLDKKYICVGATYGENPESYEN